MQTQKRHPPVLLHEGTPLSWVAGVYRYSIDKTVVHVPDIAITHSPVNVADDELLAAPLIQGGLNTAIAIILRESV